MSGLKLRSMAASIYSKPYKWVRSLTTTSIATTNPSCFCFSFSSSRSPLPPPLFISLSASRSLSISNTNPVSSAVPVVAVAHANLGFRGNATRCFAFSTSGSSVDREAAAEAASSGSDMGSEHKEVDNTNLSRHNSLPSMKNQQQQSSSSSSSSSSDKLLTLPTILTLGRVAAVPLLIGTFYVDNWWGTTATTSIFIAAAITDWLDGYLARKMKLGSAFGAFLDPVADKLMVATTLVLLCTKPLEVGLLGQVPWLLTVPSVAIIGREITMSAVREWAASQNTKLLEAVAVNNLGKWKTASQMTALTILLATRGGSLGGPGYVVSLGIALLYVSAGLAVWSLVVYMRKIWKVLLK